jgi:hypothetical protein
MIITSGERWFQLHCFSYFTFEQLERRGVERLIASSGGFVLFEKLILLEI